MSQLLGKAILSYLEHGRETELITLNSFGDQERVPVSYFFRTYDEMPLLEQRAMDLTRGTVLDIGAGAGSHCLYLMEQGHEVVALDPSEDAITCCKKRGIAHVHCCPVQEFHGGTFDTLLMLMNGIGLAGTMAGLDDLLLHLKSLLKPVGQILLDSSDIRYMYEIDADGNPIHPSEKGYYGDLHFSVYFDGQYEPPFPWVYVDYASLARIAKSVGLKAEKIMDGPHFDFLARLTVE